MSNKTRNDYLQEYLRDGEKVLWHGWPEPCKFLEETDKTRIIRNWIIECIVVGAFLAFYVSMAVALSVKFIIGTLVVLVIILCSPYMEWRKLANQEYWVTDQRVISGRGKSDFTGIDMNLVDAADVKMLATGNGCVRLCRKIIDEGEKQLRWRSSSPIGGNTPGEVGMVFYNVAHAEEALDAVRSVNENL